MTKDVCEEIYSHDNGLWCCLEGLHVVLRRWRVLGAGFSEKDMYARPRGNASCWAALLLTITWTASSCAPHPATGAAAAGAIEHELVELFRKEGKTMITGGRMGGCWAA